MGKLSVYMAMKRDLAFEFERELRAVRNLILGVTRLSGSEYTIELLGNEGFVAGSRARAAFIEAFHAATHEALVKYAHDLAHECLEHGMDQEVVSGALGGHPSLHPMRSLREHFQSMPPQPMPMPMSHQTAYQHQPMQQQQQGPAPEGAGPVRLAACA
ncbi:hypothetical protein [Hyphomicrobium sp.]|uniref:hypothetical protein n=1 Tax=Hyphomicrobium sp. TaxID=82 RepID=UPI0025BE37AA|nr:hypothetical protein [Hyphomicrobium sp.]MCC7252967.1 hypothetical protein [Hyphomicrobium sp.]